MGRLPHHAYPKNDENAIINQPEWFAFCKKHSIAPFEVTADLVDFDSSLLQDLQESFKTGSYNYNIPIIVASSNEPAVRNQMVDGRNRVVAIYILEKKGNKVKFPRIEHEEIDSVNELHCRIAQYVMQSRSKNSTLAKRIIEENLRPVIQSQIDKYGDKLPDDILTKFGFHYSTISNRLIGELITKRKHGISSKLTGKPLQPSATISRPVVNYQNGWDPNANVEGIHASPGQNFDQLTTYDHNCPKCRVNLIIVTSTKGEVVAVRHAQTVIK